MSSNSHFLSKSFFKTFNQMWLSNRSNSLLWLRFNFKTQIIFCIHLRLLLHMDDHAPHRCRQNSSKHTQSIYEKSGSTLATSSYTNVTGTQLLMAATNQKCSSNSGEAMSGPKFIVHQAPLPPNSHKRSLIWKFTSHFDSALNPHMGTFRICHQQKERWKTEWRWQKVFQALL